MIRKDQRSLHDSAVGYGYMSVFTRAFDRRIEALLVLPV